MHKIEYVGHTDVGRIRSNNEDIFLIDADAHFCLVADGMGGAAAGEMASQIFAQTAAEIIRASNPSCEQDLLDCIQNVFLSANDRILAHVQEKSEHKGMGCTAELLAFTPTGFVIGHIGDSRTYRLRQGSFKQLTKDHSLVQEQIDQGLITTQQARSHKLRNIILRAVGVRPSPVLDTLNGPIFSGDLFLLCSDGLTDLVQDYEIIDILSENSSLADRSSRLIETANHIGGKDNVTVVLAQVA